MIDDCVHYKMYYSGADERKMQKIWIFQNVISADGELTADAECINRALL